MKGARTIAKGRLHQFWMFNADLTRDDLSKKIIVF